MAFISGSSSVADSLTGGADGDLILSDGFLVIKAYGQEYLGWPIMEVYINGATQAAAAINVNSATPTDYHVATSLDPSQIQSVRLVFSNDAWSGINGGPDRNLFVQAIQVGGLTIQPADTNVGYTRTYQFAGTGGERSGLNDTLNGGLGADTMYGGVGDDTYYVDAANDVIVEFSAEGYDTVISSAGTYTLADEVEVVRLTGTDGQVIMGNDLGNSIYGNEFVNNVQAGAGDDFIQTLGGNDVVRAGLGNDYVDAGMGNDSVLADLTNDAFVEDGGDDILLGGAGNDTLVGGGGSDTINGGNDNDTEIGGYGDDSLRGDSGNDTLYGDLIPGPDNVDLGGSDTLIGGVGLDSLNGGAGNDILRGGVDSDTLVGGAGNDILDGGENVTRIVIRARGDIGAETMSIQVNGIRLNPEQALTTTETDYTFNYFGPIESVQTVDVLFSEDGPSPLPGDRNLYIIGVTVGNRTTNQASSYTRGEQKPEYFLFPWTGMATFDLSGAQGAFTSPVAADTMEGGTGDDIYVVDSDTDLVTEVPDFDADGVFQHGGFDTIYASVSIARLADHVEAADLVEVSAAPATPLSITGNDLNNVLTGNTLGNKLDGGIGNDSLNGQGGVDTLTGGVGDDTYYYDGDDVIVETNGLVNGVDTLVSTVTASLSTLNANIENLSLAGTNAVNGTGTTGDNALTGNGSANRLEGLGGNDTLSGGGGADTLVGGAGNDLYLMETGAATILEAAGGGIDEVAFTYFRDVDLLNYRDVNGVVQEIEYASISASTQDTLPAALAANHALRGNDFNNRLTGSFNNDTLWGRKGNDTIDGGFGHDTITGDEGNDWLFGGDGDDSVSGGDANDTLVESAGLDTLDGGAGNDVYVLSDFSAVIEDLSGIDEAQVFGGSQFSLASYGFLENLSVRTDEFSEVAASLTGNALANTLTGGLGDDSLYGLESNDTIYGLAGMDTLDGGAGADSMDGGLGADIYLVDNTADVVKDTGAASGETDEVRSSVSYTLAAAGQVENLVLNTGATQAKNAVGNGLSNWLQGNGNSNLIQGLGGSDTLWGGNDGNTVDTLEGGAGEDTYLLTGNGDVINDFNEANVVDTVLLQGATSLTLSTYVENANASSSFWAVNVTGNALANTLIGSGLGDTLAGGQGNDRYYGGAGNDTLTDTGTSTTASPSNDVYVWGRGDGADTVTDSAGTTDSLQIGDAVATQVWFTRAGTDMRVSLIGTGDSVLIKKWYSSSLTTSTAAGSGRIENFALSNVTGADKALNSNQVQSLVNAMAKFAVPALGTTSLPANYGAVATAVATAWV